MARVVNQILTEMDGISDRKEVFLLAATNRKDIIDHALLRPGRFDKQLYVPLPSAADRHGIIQSIVNPMILKGVTFNVDFFNLANVTSGFSGADLSHLVREAASEAVREAITPKLEGLELGSAASLSLHEPATINDYHFLNVLKKIEPSVSAFENSMYRQHLFNDKLNSEVVVQDRHDNLNTNVMLHFFPLRGSPY